MIDFDFTLEEWNKVDIDQLTDWFVTFCSEDEEVEMEDVEQNYFDYGTAEWKTRWTHVKFRFKNPKTAMAFKLAWGGNC